MRAYTRTQARQLSLDGGGELCVAVTGNIESVCSRLPACTTWRLHVVHMYRLSGQSKGFRTWSHVRHIVYCSCTDAALES